MKKNDHIAFIENFIGREWLDEEFEKINTKSPLKEAGTYFEPYHPWVHYIYELEYLVRRAHIKNRKGIIAGQYYYVLENAGMLLQHNFDYIVDKKDAQMKLRNPTQFYDFIWELETRTMLTQRGAFATFCDPKSGNTYDGTVTIIDRAIPFECKNKVLDNDTYNSNTVFSQVIANRLADVASVKNKIIQFEFEHGKLEDIKTIIAIIRDKFEVHDYQSILGRYRVRTLKKLPFSTPPQVLINREGVMQLFQIGARKDSELYLDNAPSDIIKTKLLIKMPESASELQNLNAVLKKANSQLATGGIVFLQVPYGTFENAKKEIAEELSQHFSKIYAIKLVSVDISNTENMGVKVSRFEDLILSKSGSTFLSQKEIDFLNQLMLFSKYADKNGLSI